jgi:GNAT superfamily N-acetyltransferase
MIIRKLAPGDRAQWSSLWDGYNAFYGREGPTALAPEITEATWNRFFEPDEPMHALVAEQDGELVGLAHYLFHRSTTAIAPTCYLQDLFTSEAARGQGVATALVERAADEARAQGSQRMYWQTHESNGRARKLYDRIAERSGFIIYRQSLG